MQTPLPMESIGLPDHVHTNMSQAKQVGMQAPLSILSIVLPLDQLSNALGALHLPWNSSS